jgi:pimeloyl-ACP methyl ester carboxylesterase
MTLSRAAIVSFTCLFSFIPELRAQDRYLDSGGVKIRYTVEGGTGEPVVLVHGLCVNAEIQWGIPGIAKALAREYRVIALDNRGHGKSGKPHDPKDYGPEMAEDITRLLDHLKIDKAHLVGYSLGGFITLRFLAMHPERVHTATLGGAGWPRKVDEEFLDELAGSLDQGKGITPLLKRLTPKGKPAPSEAQIKAINEVLLSRNDAKALAAAVRGMKALQVADAALASNKVPVLALIGSLDPLKEGVDEMPGRLPHLETFVIQGADHINTFAKPEFLAHLQAFLARHSQTRSPVREVTAPARR